jgi:pimeloyl-ACP methyl ester carboxylesterase
MGAFPHSRVLAWNACGYADSQPLAHPSPQVTDYAQALLRLLDSERIDSTALVASSWGTPIALAAAQMEPARISHLVLSGPTAGYGALPEAQRRSILATRGDRARTAGIKTVMEQESSRLVAPHLYAYLSPQLARAREGVPLDGFLQALYALVHADLDSLVGGIACPTLIVFGEDDMIAPPAEHAQRLAAALPKAQVQGFRNCGHLPHLEYPKSFNRLVTEFIGS